MVMKDFTRERKAIQFKIDGDTFDAKSPIPGQTLIDFAKKFSSMSESSTVDEQLTAFQGVLELVLMPASHARFVERLASPDEPIEIGQVEEVVMWLFEEYGLRPTEPGEPSANGQLSPVGGPNSTVNLPAGELTS